MRYKDENIINFSCDDKKNVTVVLGDNTVGKTTLAQAFRWGLYGELISTQYEDAKNISILNNEVLGDMTANDYGHVEVELILENTGLNGILYNYKIIRKAMFVRKFPQLIAVQRSSTLKIYLTNTETGETIPYDNDGINGKHKGKVDELISELLPKNLSSYFLFDGERWSNEKSTKSDIKDSIYTLVGISPIREMKRHLGENGRLSVIRQLKSKITGSGEEYVKIIESIERYNQKIEVEERNIKEAGENAKSYESKASQIEQLLNSNPNIEQDQKDCEQIKKNMTVNENHMKTFYGDIVTNFSLSHTYFAAPLLEQIVDLLKEVELEGVDIPGVTDKTIDYLMQRHECLCGHKIIDNSFEAETLLKLRKLVPPAVIGARVGNYEDKIRQWNANSADLFASLLEKAKLYQLEYYDMLDNEEALGKKEKKIDNKINFAQERIKMNGYKKQACDENEKVRKSRLNIDDYRERINSLEKTKETLDEKTLTNKKLKKYIAYAEELYRLACKIYQDKEGTLLTELNEIIEKNFREMFNEQEKVAKLGQDYILRLFYKRISNTNGYSGLEATGLSEGEKIARNFAFIVSILELANKIKQDGDEIAQSLPLVLDGPFSKLSSVNTSKVASVLPDVSDQVIIFMLDKDWEPSGLQEYTDKQYMYRTVKEIEGNSSTICAAAEV